MPTASTSKAAEVFLFFGLLLLVPLHLFALAAVPGLHFDEAWAMNYAWQLAQGEWSFRAMSPYTAPWAHYWAALWMKVLGPNLFVYRLSQVFLSLVGVALLAMALRKRGSAATAMLLALAVALAPGLVMNHRFAVELTGFHALCLGLFAWALAQRSPWLLAFAWVLGTTSHVLFYGIGLALVAAMVWEGESWTRRERLALSVAALGLGAFFLQVLAEVPEKGKAAALLLSALVLSGGIWLKPERWQLWRRPFWGWLALVAAAVFLVNSLFFLDGGWSVALTTGREPWKGGRILSLVCFLPLAAYLAFTGAKDFSRFERRLFLLGVIFLGLMMLKPAPRYYEMILLGLAVFVAAGLARLPFLWRVAAVAALVLHAVVVYADYFTTAPREASLRFLLFKDSSRDFLSKQELVSVLGGSGCGLSDIQGVDSRVQEALKALSLGDWPRAGQACRWRSVLVERKAEAGRSRGANVEEAADFVIGEKP